MLHYQKNVSKYLKKSIKQYIRLHGILIAKCLEIIFEVEKLARYKIYGFSLNNQQIN